MTEPPAALPTAPPSLVRAWIIAGEVMFGGLVLAFAFFLASAFTHRAVLATAGLIFLIVSMLANALIAFLRIWRALVGMRRVGSEDRWRFMQRLTLAAIPPAVALVAVGYLAIFCASRL